MILKYLNIYIHCDNFTEPISNPESSITGKIVILFDCIKSIASETFVFDFYNDVERNKWKLGFRFIFQSLKKTLTDVEVDYIINDIVKSVSQLDGVDVPGYDYKNS